MPSVSQAVARPPVVLDVERVGLALALSLHVAALAWLGLSLHRPAAPTVHLMSVRLLSPAPVAPSLQPHAMPTPPAKVRPVTPPPITRVASQTPAPAPAPVVPVPPRETPRPAEPVVVKSAEPSNAPPVEATLPPRFDADYLDNPSPRYPPISRRVGEQGRVLLRVQVSVAGEALNVQIHQSSGYSRLDQSAAEAVRDWRFVPARRGQQAVSEWVVVPVVFSLTR